MGLRILKQILQYSFSLLIALGVLWYVLQDIALEEMLKKAVGLDYFWIGLSLLFSLVAYILRAYRWNLLLAPIGYRLGFIPTFLAMMVGYLANLLLPRLGEIIRCGALKRSDQVPVSTSLGTVVAERIIDLLFLIGIIIVTLVLEIDKLAGFLKHIFSGESKLPATSALLYTGMGMLVVLVLCFWFYKKNKVRIREHTVFKKASAFLSSLLSGFLSIGKLENPYGFWLSSFFIWVMYYLMSYIVVFTLPQTSGMDIFAGMAILAMGGIGMAAPVQGGLGTYHLLVSGVLMIYGASKSDAVLLAFVLHTSQTLLVIFVGVVSLFGSFVINRGKVVIVAQDENN